jgi:hypothetical protein
MDYLQNILRLIKAAPGEQITDRECIEILLYTVDMAGIKTSPLNAAMDSRQAGLIEDGTMLDFLFKELENVTV